MWLLYNKGNWPTKDLGRMKTNTRKQVLKTFKEVKVQLHIAVKLNLASSQKISAFESVIDPKIFSNPASSSE